MKKSRVILAIAAVALMAAMYLHYENTALQVSRYTIGSSKIPQEFDGYKIVQVSDFHNNEINELTDELMIQVEAEKPDMIVITGDLIDSRKTDVQTALEMVGRLCEIGPVYYVTGNHEGRVEEYSDLKQGLLKAGVTVMDDSVIGVKKGEGIVELIGINDPYFSEASQYIGEAQAVADQLTMLLNADESDRYRILLSHRPELIETYDAADVDLVFTGHAHGGQIRVPFVGGLIAPNQGFLPKYTEGVYTKGETQMVVSRGIGNSLFPFRVNNRPELVAVTLDAE